MPKNKPPLEKSIVNSILKALRALPKCKVLKMHGNQYAEKGTPDIIGSLYGHAFALEVKRPGGKTTKIQDIRLAEWAAAGAVTAVVTSVDEALQALNNLRGIKVVPI